MNKSKSFDPIWVPIISQYQNTKNLDTLGKHFDYDENHRSYSS